MSVTYFSLIGSCATDPTCHHILFLRDPDPSHTVTHTSLTYIRIQANSYGFGSESFKNKHFSKFELLPLTSSFGQVPHCPKNIAVHCPKNNLNFRLKTEPVTAEADATTHVRLLLYLAQNWTNTVAPAPTVTG